MKALRVIELFLHGISNCVIDGVPENGDEMILKWHEIGDEMQLGLITSNL